MRRTKIVCTIGPAVQSERMLGSLLRAGMDAARLNFSHGDHPSHALAIERLRRLSDAMGRPLAIIQDLAGPKPRIGAFAAGSAELRPGQSFALTSDSAPGDQRRVSVGFAGLLDCLRPGERLLLADGGVELKVLSASRERAETRVVVGGRLSSHQGVNLPDTELPVPAVTDKDLADLDFGIQQGVDWVAMSFVRSPADLEPLRQRMAERGAGIPVIAKIEKREAIERLDEIIEAADGVMVARGDLGLELPLERVPLLQKQIIRRANRAGKPVITATQMLDSMIRSPRPTRAEVTDVANAILDGTDAVMLSGETAIGQYPRQAVRVMARVTAWTERTLDYHRIHAELMTQPALSVTDAVTAATCEIAMDLNARAVICSTSSGYTAIMISRHRLPIPTVAATASPQVKRRLALAWGVSPLLVPPADDTDQMIAHATAAAVRQGWARQGDLVAFTAGIPPGAGRTNLIRVGRIGPREELV